MKKNSTISTTETNSNWIDQVSLVEPEYKFHVFFAYRHQITKIEIKPETEIGFFFVNIIIIILCDDLDYKWGKERERERENVKAKRKKIKNPSNDRNNKRVNEKISIERQR